MAVSLALVPVAGPVRSARPGRWRLVSANPPGNCRSKRSSRCFCLAPSPLSRGRPGWGLIYLGSGLSVSAPSAGTICQPAVGGGGKGAKGPAPLTPGRWFMPTVGKAPGSGILSTGREPHAIHGVTLPFAVILTAHRLRSPLHPARQTASGLGGKSNEQKLGSAPAKQTASEFQRYELALVR